MAIKTIKGLEDLKEVHTGDFVRIMVTELERRHRGSLCTKGYDYGTVCAQRKMLWGLKMYDLSLIRGTNPDHPVQIVEYTIIRGLNENEYYNFERTPKPIFFVAGSPQHTQFCKQFKRSGIKRGAA